VCTITGQFEKTKHSDIVSNISLYPCRQNTSQTIVLYN